MTWHHCWNVIGFMLNCTLQGLSVNFSNQSYGSHIIQLLHSFIISGWQNCYSWFWSCFFLSNEWWDQVNSFESLVLWLEIVVSITMCGIKNSVCYPELCVVSRTMCGIHNSKWYSELCLVYIFICGIQNYMWYPELSLRSRTMCGI